ncbi:MAG: hypothetical protein PHT94_01480 [Candidatus Nanoarchaeia archaeon]|nr:hypothetical protein [Candidatus Nanoarchaeia archaeon]
MKNEKSKIKDEYNPNTAFKILENNGGFQTFGWIERDTKSKFEFCEYLEKLPHDLRIRILKHTSQINDSVKVFIDTWDLYQFFKEYPNFIVTKNVSKNSKAIYMDCITNKDPTIISHDFCETFKHIENLSWSVEKGNIEDTIYIEFF